MYFNLVAYLFVFSASTTVLAGPVGYRVRRGNGVEFNTTSETALAGVTRSFEFVSQEPINTSQEEQDPEPTQTDDNEPVFTTTVFEPAPTDEHPVVVTTTVFKYPIPIATQEPVPTTTTEEPIPTGTQAPAPSEAPSEPPSELVPDPRAPIQSSNLSATATNTKPPNPSSSADSDKGNDDGTASDGASEANKALALKQNRKFAKLTSESTCDSSDPTQLNACIGRDFMRCENGAYTVAFECAQPTACFALPLEQSEGLSVACITVAEAATRMGIEKSELEAIIGGEDDSNDEGDIPVPTSSAPSGELFPTTASAEPIQTEPSGTTTAPEVGPTSVDNPAGVAPITTATSEPAPSDPATPDPSNSIPSNPAPPVVSVSIATSTQIVTMTTMMTSVVIETSTVAPSGNPNAPVVTAIN